MSQTNSLVVLVVLLVILKIDCAKKFIFTILNENWSYNCQYLFKNIQKLEHTRFFCITIFSAKFKTCLYLFFKNASRQ